MGKILIYNILYILYYGVFNLNIWILYFDCIKKLS